MTAAEKDKLKDLLDTSSNLNRNLGLGFITIVLFIATTIFSTTDKMLLISKELIKIPLINVELPLIPYFLTIPAILIGIHLNVLINFFEHSKTYFHWYDNLTEEERKTADTFSHPFLLNYVLVRKGDSLSYWFMRVLVELVSFFLPMALLHYIQLRFSDYQDFNYTLTHFAYFCTDAILVFYYRPKIFNYNSYKGNTSNVFLLHWQDGLLSFYRWIPHFIRKKVNFFPKPQSSFISHITLLILFLLPVLHGSINLGLVKLITDDNKYKIVSKYFISTEQIEVVKLENMKSYQFMIRHYAYKPNIEVKEANLFNNDPSERINTFNISDSVEAYIEKMRMLYAEGLYLRRRCLRYCNLSDSKLYNAHLEGAKMDYSICRNANFNHANMDSMHLEMADLNTALLNKANLRGAIIIGGNLSNTKLQYAKLLGANMQNVELSAAELKGADFSFAKLQGANLSDAKLQGTYLFSAELINANLFNAELQALLSNAKLRGANLSHAKLQGADLHRAELQGADLSFAKLQGASLYSAQLQETDLRFTQLQGANLHSAELQEAFLEETQFKAAYLSNANFTNVIIKENTTFYGTYYNHLNYNLENNKQKIKIPSSNFFTFIAARKELLRDKDLNLKIRNLLLYETENGELGGRLTKNAKKLRKELLQFAKMHCPAKYDEYIKEYGDETDWK